FFFFFVLCWVFGGYGRNPFSVGLGGGVVWWFFVLVFGLLIWGGVVVVVLVMLAGIKDVGLKI
ncbi:hypothetical protein ACQWKR_23705, partial [Salmonella enterica subsp. enterica serovar Infantis]